MNKQRIAEAYLDGYAVTQNSAASPLTLPTWEAYALLAKECMLMANVLRGRFNITEVANPEPYKTAVAMFGAIELDRFEVSNLFCDHPLWTPTENIAFRIVHDWYGHWGRKGDTLAAFSWKGEQRAYHSQCRYHSRLAQRVLFTEIVGQTACYSLTGEFPQQKAILLPRELDA